jgi:hypothetical protein
VTTPFVALLWILHCRVAVDAARVNEDGTNLLPGGEPIGSRDFTGFFLPGRASKHTNAQEKQRRSKPDCSAIARHV